jgi:hypothetical protein
MRKLHKKSLTKAQDGSDFRFRPRYMPLNYGMDASGVNIGDAFNVLKSGYQDFFSGNDKDDDGFKDGIFRQMGAKKDYRKNTVVPKMYDYKVMYDGETTPGNYEYDAKALYEASKFGKRLLGNNTIDPTGKVNYSNDPNDPTNTYFTDSTFNFKNKDSINAPEGLSTLTPQAMHNMFNSMGIPTPSPKKSNFKNILNDAQDIITEGTSNLMQGVDKLGNNMEDVFNDFIDKGALTAEDIKNKSEKFIETMKTFYQDKIKDKIKINFQTGGGKENSRRSEREYDQNRLLEIQKLLENGNITKQQQNDIIGELSNFSNLENKFLGDIRLYMRDLDDNINTLPSRQETYGVDSETGKAYEESVPGGGLVSKGLYNWLNENNGFACNTYACSILKDAGVTYPINMEPMTINGRTYKGGDPKAVIPGNLQQDGFYNYNTGSQGFVMTDPEDEVLPGDYGRIGYPNTGHAVLYTGEKEYTPEGGAQRYRSVYNPGNPRRGLKVGDSYGPVNAERFDVNEIDSTQTTRYVGNSLFIDELMNDVQNIRPQNKKVVSASDLESQPVSEPSGTLPKAQTGIPKYDFSFSGTPIPVMQTFPIMEEQTSMSTNPDFNFMSMLRPQTDLSNAIQSVQDSQLQQRFPNLGPTPFQQQQQSNQPFIENTEMVQVGEEERQVGIQNPAAPEVQGVKVKRDFGKGLKGLANRVGTGMKKMEDTALAKGFTAGSEFAVGAASVVNDFFQDKKIADAQNEMRRLNMADNQFGTSESTDRGLYDANSGLLMPDMSVTTSYGKDGGELEVDELTLKQLIAAGADIQIIE